MGRLYRPRALLRLAVAVPGQTEPIAFEVPVVRARHVKNDHNHADTLDVTLDWADTGVDPRWIASAIGEYHLGVANDAGAWEPTKDNRRFIGRLVEVSRIGEGDSLHVEMTFHDYTSFFLLAKPVSTDAIPSYSDTLDQAWSRLCGTVPGALELDELELRGLEETPVIGTAVAERFRKRGHLAVKPGLDAWAVWQQAVGMMGLISFFEADTCIVTTARDLYTSLNPPQIVYGRNLFSFSEHRNNDRVAKGVIVTSFDAVSGTAIEAAFNPHAGNVKKLGAKGKKSKKPKFLDVSKEYDVFPYPGITDQTTLKALAERIYVERIRQELEGAATTKDFDVETASGVDFDLLSLGSGDAVEIRFLGDEDAAFVKKFDTQQQRSSYLQRIGYSPSVADIIAANVDKISSRSNLFHVKSVTTNLETTGDGGGSFSVELSYCNKIDVGGGTQEP
jgi:hypothetical protein